MMSTPAPYIVMPVKDSVDMAERALRAVAQAGLSLTVYDDYSSDENALRLRRLTEQMGHSYIALRSLTASPSPNYRTTLIHARRQALAADSPLLIVESDVMIRPDTVRRLMDAAQPGVGMVAAITVDESGAVNYPYAEGRRHLSFCCTLLTCELLRTLDFSIVLDPAKSWYDVTISHLCEARGLSTVLLRDATVVHYPHSSRPWKLLKYTNPIRYYWMKWTKRLDRI